MRMWRLRLSGTGGTLVPFTVVKETEQTVTYEYHTHDGKTITVKAVKSSNQEKWYRSFQDAKTTLVHYLMRRIANTETEMATLQKNLSEAYAMTEPL